MTFRVVDNYIHPISKASLTKDDNGNLCEQGDTKNILYRNDNGIYDFVIQQDDNEERGHYDNLYSATDNLVCSDESLQKMWREEPGFEQLLESMGDISGKKILLLGNGTSTKEFYFLCRGAKCVYTDLSIEAIKQMKVMLEQSKLIQEGISQIDFHVVDACHLPFEEDSFDIIYGCSFVHHIEDLDALFLEISRCLKPGGICRFLDHAYSPLWQGLKNTLLKPIQLYTHRKHGISPADMLAIQKGGFNSHELLEIQQQLGFKDMLYLKVAFFEQLLQRGTLKLGGKWLRVLKPAMKMLDMSLDKVTKFIKNHGIVLVWGFTK